MARVTANWGSGPVHTWAIDRDLPLGRRQEAEPDAMKDHTPIVTEAVKLEDRDNMTVRRIQRMAPEKIAQLIFVREGETIDDIPDR